jgi:hypothetical protein
MDTAERLSGYALHPVQRLGIAIAVVIKHRNGVACIQQFHAGVAANVARATSHQNISIHAKNGL